MSGLIDAMGGRRFLLCLGAGMVTTVLVWHGSVDGNIYRDVILGTIGAFVAGNTYQKVKEAAAP